MAGLMPTALLLILRLARGHSRTLRNLHLIIRQPLIVIQLTCMHLITSRIRKILEQHKVLEAGV